MKSLLVVLVFIQGLVFADYQYYYYDKMKLNFSKESHDRYIKPQLKNIKTEYFFLAKKLNPLQNTIFKLREAVLKLVLDYNEKYKECIIQQREQLYCEVDVSTLLKDSYEVDQNIMTLRVESLNKENFNLDNISNYFLFSKHLDQVEILNSRVQRYLELKNIVKGTIYTTYTSQFSDLTNTIINLNNTINFVFIEQLPDEVKDAFEALLVEFISPLERNLINKYSPEWFKLELGSLNLAWNTFHMTLEKGSKTFPVSLVSLVKIMHNRWNSVLKLIF